MANLRRQPVSYKPFSGQAILADGLLAVDRPGGDLMRSVAQDLFGLAGTFQRRGERDQALADEAATKAGTLAGEQYALDNLPKASVTGGTVVEGDSNGERPPVYTNAPKSGTAMDAIGRAAARYGVPANALYRIAQLESSLNPGAENPTSSAGGLFQQTNANAAQYGVVNRFDPYQSADGAARFMRDNISYLTKRLGRPPTQGELYLAHQQGAGGAAKLLANPNARAIDVVGNGPVRLNGGDPTMSAAAFANLWIRKASGEPVTMTGSAARRTPVEIKISGKLKLLNDGTKFGDAFDQASTHAYVAQLQDEMLSAGSQLYEKYKDDPLELAHAFEELHKAQIDEHVPPGIRLDYEQGFSRMQRKYLAQAQNAHEDKIEQADKNAFQGDAEKYAESVAKAEAGIDPNDENSLTVLQAEAARYKDHIQEGAARKYISEADAKEAARLVDSRVAVAWHVAQAKGKTSSEVAELRDELKKDYAKGELEGVDGDSYAKIDARLRQIETQTATQENKARTEAGKVAREQKAASKADAAAAAKAEKELAADQQKALRVVQSTAKSFATRVAAGEEIPAAEVEAFHQAANRTPEGPAIARATEDVLEIGTLLRGGPVKAAEERLAEMRGKTKRPIDAIQTGNIDLYHRPQVKNPDGSISTVRSMSFEEGGEEILIPTVSPDGKILSNEEAIALYHKTGEHLGKFQNAKAADAYAQQLHQDQENFYRAKTPYEIAALKTSQAIITEARRNLATDPLGFGFKSGVIEDPGLVTDAKEPAELAGLVQKRLEMAGDVAQHFQVDPYIFRPGEPAALDKLVRADPAKGAQIAAALIVGAGDQAPEMLREFGATAPVIAGAGTIIANHGSPVAAQELIAGSGKKEGGGEYSVKGLKTRRAAGFAIVNEALAFQPSDGARILQGAEWIARKRMADAGIESDDEDVPKIYERALNEAAGAVYGTDDVQYGGFTGYDPTIMAAEHQIMVPNYVRADQIYNVIHALQDSDFEIKPMGGVATVKDLWPVLTERGYVFVNFDADGAPIPLNGTDGKPWILDIDALAPTLGGRVAGAIRGY